MKILVKEVETKKRELGIPCCDQMAERIGDGGFWLDSSGTITLQLGRLQHNRYLHLVHCPYCGEKIVEHKVTP